MSRLKRPKLSFTFRLLFALFPVLLVVSSLALNIYLLRGGTRVSEVSIAAASRLVGLDFSRSQRKQMEQDVRENLAAYRQLRQVQLPNSVAPSLLFNPLPPGFPLPAAAQAQAPAVRGAPSPAFQLPASDEEIAFLPVHDLAELIRTRQLTSTRLTRIYLERLKKFGPKLECVITLTEKLALEQARRADEEIAAGKYRGPLHGIPWGAKDLLDTRGIRTTWGAMPYKDRMADTDATVVERLASAGAVLLAKLTLGELAWGDVWFGGKTRNPWDLNEGSSGSSAGPAAATAAGLVGFAIGSETWGSIVSPSSHCGVTGLRPTFGRVSRAGAMALSWSMDKLGPICRSVEDCALVLAAICGPDGKDLSVPDIPCAWNPQPALKEIRLGFLEKEFAQDYRTRANDLQTLATLRSLGFRLVPLHLPDLPVDALSFILNAEAAAAFDELTRSGRDSLLARQVREAWPNIFRQARLIPAVEYIQANRVRALLMAEMARRLRDIDVYVAPSFVGDNLLLTNLTGHPALVLPNGFDGKAHPTSITFIGSLFGEEKLLAVGRAYQEASDFQRRHPQLKAD